jgi:hypothetical protein
MSVARIIKSSVKQLAGAVGPKDCAVPNSSCLEGKKQGIEDKPEKQGGDLTPCFWPSKKTTSADQP